MLIKMYAKIKREGRSAGRREPFFWGGGGRWGVKAAHPRKGMGAASFAIDTIRKLNAPLKTK